jgi:uncharacterized protein (TIGR02594 family)
MRTSLTVTALLLCSIASFTSPALADAPESSVRAVADYPMQGAGTSSKRIRHIGSGRHSVHGASRHASRERRRTVHEHAAREHAEARHSRRASRSMRGESSSRELARRDNSDRNPITSSGGSSVVSEARRWIGTNPTGRASLWCARFMNFVLKRTGFRGTSSDMAQSFASYGKRVPGPRVGAIAVMSRGRRGGHVGVVSGIDSRGNPIIISGNYGRRVAEATYSKGRIYAYVMP